MRNFPSVAKKFIIPIIMNDAVSDTKPKKRYLKIIPMATPRYAPMNSTGAKTPQLPPDVIELVYSYIKVYYL